MSKFYAKSTGGFYDSDIHKTMPDDAVEITDELHTYLINGQSSGKKIIEDAEGNPILIDRVPSAYHKLVNLEWVIDSSKKQEALAELTRRFNAATESLIINSKITYSNSNGSIEITCDTITQQNFTALYIMREFQTYPYEVWEKNTSLNLVDSTEAAELCQMIMANVETIRRQRKVIRDTFSKMTTVKIIEQLESLS